MNSEEITELKSARDLAMRNAAKARKPECGYFGVIAQTLDACLPSIEAQQETITHLTNRVEELEEALKELMCIVDIEQSNQDNKFAWAEMNYAKEIISKE